MQVSDAPLLNKRGIAHPAKASSPHRRSLSSTNKRQQQSTTRAQPTPPPMHGPTGKAASKPKTAARPLHVPPATPSQATTNNISTTSSRPNVSKAVVEPRAKAPEQKPFLKLSQSEPPQHFYAPEARNRVRSNKPVIRDNTGKRFNNHQHLNNVRKKMNEDRPPPLPQNKASNAEPPENREPDAARDTGPPHASWLFFDDEEDTRSRQDISEQAIDAPSITSNQQESTMQGRECAVAGNQEQLDAPGVTLPDVSGLEHEAGTRAANPEDKADPTLTTASHDAVAHSADLGEVDQPNGITTTAISPQIDIPVSKDVGTKTRPRRNSLSNREFSAPVTTDHRKDSPPRPRPLQSEPLKALPPVASRGQLASAEPSRMFTSTAQNYTSHGEIVRAHNGREWRKGDIVLDLYLHHQAAGGIKLLHVPWEYAAPIVALKQGPQLPIGFSPTITRSQYELLAKDRWFSYFAIAAVEPFNDTLDGVTSLADFLEARDIAGLWEHPDKDLMLVLYSCKSPSWQTLGQKPVRRGEPRLHIAFRRKFQEPGPSVETLARIVERGIRIEEELEARGREARIRSQTSEQRDASRRRGRSPSRSRTGTVDPRRDVRRARSISRPPSETDGERDEHEDTNRGWTSSQPAMTSLPPVRSVAPPKDTPLSPGVQLLRELQITMSPQYDGTVSDDAMNISPISPQRSDAQALRSDITLTASSAPPTVTTNIPDGTMNTTNTRFVGLDRNLKDLSWLSNSSIVDNSSVFVILVHKLSDSGRIQQLKSWLMEEGLPSSHIFDKSISGQWAEFCRQIANSVCVMLFDKRYPVINLDGLAKWLERDNLLCWEVDYLAVGDVPFQTTRLFPRGIAMAIPEGCFIHEPSATLSVLKWFKAKVSKPCPSSKLMIPPTISFVLQEQAILARKESNKNQYLDIAKLLLETNEINDSKYDASDSGLDEEHGLEFSVLQPTWTEVYKDIPQTDERLSAIEAKERDINKDDRLLQYFGAWAARHLKDHRRFITFTINDEMGQKPKDVEHVRLQLIKGFADHRLGKAKASSSRAKEKDEPRNQSRARSKSRVGSASTMSTPRT